MPTLTTHGLNKLVHQHLSLHGWNYEVCEGSGDKMFNNVDDKLDMFDIGTLRELEENQTHKRSGDDYKHVQFSTPAILRKLCSMGVISPGNYCIVDYANTPSGLVNWLNTEVYEQLDGQYVIACENMPFSFHSNGYVDTILFMDQNVWDSENHSLFDKEDCKIPLEDYVREQTRKLIKNISSIKV